MVARGPEPPLMQAGLFDPGEVTALIWCHLFTCEQRASQATRLQDHGEVRAGGGGGLLGSQCPSQGAAWPWQMATIWDPPCSHDKLATAVSA